MGSCSFGAGSAVGGFTARAAPCRQRLPSLEPRRPPREIDCRRHARAEESSAAHRRHDRGVPHRTDPWGRQLRRRLPVRQHLSGRDGRDQGVPADRSGHASSRRHDHAAVLCYHGCLRLGAGPLSAGGEDALGSGAPGAAPQHRAGDALSGAERQRLYVHGLRARPAAIGSARRIRYAAACGLTRHPRTAARWAGTRPFVRHRPSRHQARKHPHSQRRIAGADRLWCRPLRRQEW